MVRDGSACSITVLSAHLPSSLVNDLSSLLGLFTGKDIEIVEFHPPPMTFSFEIEFSVVIWTPPIVNLVLGFGCSATLDYALVSGY